MRILIICAIILTGCTKAPEPVPTTHSERMQEARHVAQLAKVKARVKYGATYLKEKGYKGDVSGALKELSDVLNFSTVAEGLEFEYFNPGEKWKGDATPYVRVTLGNVTRVFNQDGSSAATSHEHNE